MCEILKYKANFEFWCGSVRMHWKSCTRSPHWRRPSDGIKVAKEIRRQKRRQWLK